MLTQPQADLVSHFDRLRQESVEVEARLVPTEVGPYAAQLLHAAQLVAVVPALWIDVEAGEVDAVTEGGDVFTKDLTVELVFCTVNQAGPGALFADGLALASWALDALLAEPLPVGGRMLRPTGPVRFRRLASDERFYAGRITADLEVDA